MLRGGRVDAPATRPRRRRQRGGQRPAPPAQPAPAPARRMGHGHQKAESVATPGSIAASAGSVSTTIAARRHAAVIAGLAAVHQRGELFQAGVVADQQQALGIVVGVGQRRQRAGRGFVDRILEPLLDIADHARAPPPASRACAAPASTARSRAPGFSRPASGRRLRLRPGPRATAAGRGRPGRRWPVRRGRGAAGSVRAWQVCASGRLDVMAQE